MKIRIEPAQILIFLFVYFSGSFYLLSGDDFKVANSLYIEMGHNIKTLYLHWNARLPPIILCYLLIHKSINFLTIFLLNVTTAIFFVYFLKKTYQIALNKKQLSIIGYCLFSVCLIYYLMYTAGWHEVVLWKTGVIVYFYGSFFALIMIQHLFIEPKKIDNHKLLFLYFFLGILLGGYHELIAIFMFCIYFIFFAYQIFLFSIKDLLDKFKLQVVFLIGMIIGFSVILMAPGTWARKAKVEKIATDHSLWHKLNFAFSHYFQYKIKLYLAMFVFLIFIVILIRYIKNKSVSAIEKRIIFNCLLFGMSLLILSSFAYTYEGYIGGRVTFLYDVLLFMVFTQTIFYLFQNGKIVSYFQMIDNRVAGILLLSTLTYPLTMYYLCFMIYNHQIKSFDLLENKANQDVILYHSKRNTFFNLYSCLSPDPTAWQNVLFAKYYGIKSVSEI